MLLNVDVSSMLSILSGVYIHMVSLFFVELHRHWHEMCLFYILFDYG